MQTPYIKSVSVVVPICGDVAVHMRFGNMPVNALPDRVDKTLITIAKEILAAKV